MFPCKTLYLLRGQPGSGKSSLAKLVAPEHNYAADDYFTDSNGNYLFIRGELGKAHKQCQDNVERDMKQGVHIIAIANTFVKRQEAEPYFELAKKYGYNIFIVHCQNDFGSVHNVPDEALERMRRLWQDDIGETNDKTE